MPSFFFGKSLIWPTVAAILKPEGKNLKEWKSADAKALYSMAVGYHGGLFDENGNVIMVKKGLSKDIQKLSMTAAKLLNKGKAETHNEAISLAADLLDMEKSLPMPETQEEFDALPSGTKYIDPDDNKEYVKQ